MGTWTLWASNLCLEESRLQGIYLAVFLISLAPKVILLRALWSLLDGIWGIFKGGEGGPGPLSLCSEAKWTPVRQFLHIGRYLTMWKDPLALAGDRTELPGKPVACNFRLLWLNNGILWGAVACYFRLLGVPGRRYVMAGAEQEASQEAITRPAVCV